MATLEEIVEILDGRRVPLNADERRRRTSGKPANVLFPYYGATGRVGQIDGYLFDEPLILLGEDGVPFLDPERPKAYLIEGKTWVNNHAHVLRVKDGIVDRRYLVNWLNVCDYRGLVTGTTRMKLTQASMRRIPVPIAPIAEQRRIGQKVEQILGLANKCYERIERVPDILERFRRAIFNAAVTGTLTRNWRRQNAIHSSDPNKKLGELVAIRTGPFGSSLHKSDYVKGGTPVVNPMHLVNGRICPDDSARVDADVLKRLSEFKLMMGDVVMGRRGEMGRCAVVGRAESGWLCGTGSIILRSSNEIDPSYLAIVIRSPTSVRYLQAEAVGSTMVNLNQDILKNLRLRLPSMREQHESVQLVKALLTVEEELVRRLNRTRRALLALKPALLRKTFRGQLLPQDPDDEPASELLSRIRGQRFDASGVPKSPARKSAR